MSGKLKAFEFLVLSIYALFKYNTDFAVAWLLSDLPLNGIYRKINAFYTKIRVHQIYMFNAIVLR